MKATISGFNKRDYGLGPNDLAIQLVAETPEEETKLYEVLRKVAFPAGTVASFSIMVSGIGTEKLKGLEIKINL